MVEKARLVEVPATSYTVTIDGRVIEFTPPAAHKGFAALILAPRDKTSQGIAAIRADFDWFAAGISDDDDAWLQDRLQDPASPLDVVTVLKAIREVFNEITGSPTTPSQP